MAILISVLALLATFYQLYLQRLHNEKSLKPLGQIDLVDSKTQIYVYIQNSGLGPLILDKLIFVRDNKEYTKISDCLDLDTKSYWHMLVTDTVKKVVLPNSHFIVFEKNIENYISDDIDYIRKQLASITLKVAYRDIYDNKFSFERNLEWFSRHIKNMQR